MKINIINLRGHSIVVLIVLALSGGCSKMETAFFYNPIQPLKLGPRVGNVIAVSQFRDERGTDYEDNSIYAILPLVPFATYHHDRPGEKYGDHPGPGPPYHFQPSKDFAKDLAFDLRRSALFSKVIYSEQGYPDGADYVIHGAIRSTKIKGKFFGYLISPFTGFMFLMGFPTGHSTNEVDLSVQLIDVQTKQIIWENSFQKKTSHLLGLYRNFKSPYAGYPVMIEEINKEIVTSVEKELRKWNRSEAQ